MKFDRVPEVAVGVGIPGGGVVIIATRVGQDFPSDNRTPRQDRGDHVNETDSKHRRWFQFGLRRLFIMTLVLSLPLSWFAVRLGRGNEGRDVACR